MVPKSSRSSSIRNPDEAVKIQNHDFNSALEGTTDRLIFYIDTFAPGGLVSVLLLQIRY